MESIIVFLPGYVIAIFQHTRIVLPQFSQYISSMQIFSILNGVSDASSNTIWGNSTGIKDSFRVSQTCTSFNTSPPRRAGRHRRAGRGPSRPCRRAGEGGRGAEGTTEELIREVLREDRLSAVNSILYEGAAPRAIRRALEGLADADADYHQEFRTPSRGRYRAREKRGLFGPNNSGKTVPSRRPLSGRRPSRPGSKSAASMSASSSALG